MKHIITSLFATLLALQIFPSTADVNFYGPGGPHKALIKVAESFETDTGVKVNVHFCPQVSWNNEAKTNADNLFALQNNPH